MRAGVVVVIIARQSGKARESVDLVWQVRRSVRHAVAPDHYPGFYPGLNPATANLIHYLCNIAAVTRSNDKTVGVA